MGDCFSFGRGDVGRLEEAQRVARVHRALFRIERAVGGEHDLVVVEEGQPHRHAGFRRERRGVGVERVLEVIERTLFELLQQYREVFVRGARAELIPAGADAAPNRGARPVVS